MKTVETYSVYTKQMMWVTDMLTCLGVTGLRLHDMLRTVMSIGPEPRVYRVYIYTPERKAGVKVMCFGMDAVDCELEGEYDSVDELPDWVKERLAVLMVMPSTPPTVELEGVGRRISASVFWVHAPKDGTSDSTGETK